VKEMAKLIKDFGQKLNFPKLMTGHFPTDELEAWKFAAVTAKLTNGIGVYRPVDKEQLQTFLVITEFVDNKTAQHIKSFYIECAAHEYGRRTFVCQHLNHTAKVGFHEVVAKNDFRQAWCNECEAARQKKGRWNEKSMASLKIKVVCDKCYFEMKELNLEHR
jgi:hypothetical protein